jgi:sensor domain CHASE-containing protein
MDKYIAYQAGSTIEGTVIDKVTLITWGIFLLAMAMFWWFGRFTLNLMRQHQNIYQLLFAIEEEEKERNR